MASATMNPLISAPKIWPPTIKCVIRTIDRYKMFAPGEKVLIGVSGGPDSVALLHMLHALSPHYPLKLAVAHLNHGLRPGVAEKEELFVRQMAETLELPFHRKQADIGNQSGSVEERSREARYAFFDELMRRHGYTKIALGHQKNDNAEAVLMHLLRGSGIRGLAGIPPVRDQRIVRPLIRVDRAHIKAYLKDNDIPFVVDATNADPAYDRNRIRHGLIPLLKKEYNANIIETLHRTADLCREEDAWLSHHLRPKLDELILQSHKDRLVMNSRMLSAEPLAVQRRLIRDAMHLWIGHLRRIGANHIDAIIALLPAEASGKKINLPNTIEARRDTDHLSFFKGSESAGSSLEKRPEFCYMVPGIDRLPLTMEIPEFDGRIIIKVGDLIQPSELPLHDKDRAWFDLDELTFPLRIRSIRPGDRVRPYGMQGSKKVKKMLIDQKIDAAKRHNIALLESNGNIIWVIGIRRGNQAVVSGRTRRILEVRVVRTPEQKARH